MKSTTFQNISYKWVEIGFWDRLLIWLFMSHSIPATHLIEIRSQYLIAFRFKKPLSFSVFSYTSVKAIVILKEVHFN